MLKNPLLSWTDAKSLAEDCRTRGGRIVTTNGCFDLIHRGHITYLLAARALGDILLVGLNSDASVQRFKGPSRPLNSAIDRAFVLSQLRMVDGVCLFEEDTPINWLSEIRPHVHVKGGDWKAETMPETAVLSSWGARIVNIPTIEGYSTTSLIQKSKK